MKNWKGFERSVRSPVTGNNTRAYSTWEQTEKSQ